MAELKLATFPGFGAKAIGVFHTCEYDPKGEIVAVMSVDWLVQISLHETFTIGLLLYKM